MTIEKIAILVITRGYQSCIKTSQDHRLCSAKLPSAGGVERSKAVARQIQDRTLGNHHLQAQISVCDVRCEMMLEVYDYTILMATISIWLVFLWLYYMAFY